MLFCIVYAQRFWLSSKSSGEAISSVDNNETNKDGRVLRSALPESPPGRIPSHHESDDGCYWRTNDNAVSSVSKKPNTLGLGVINTRPTPRFIVEELAKWHAQYRYGYVPIVSSGRGNGT